MPKFRIKQAPRTIRATRPTVVAWQTQMSAHAPDPWDEPLPSNPNYTHASYWSQRIEAIIRLPLNWHMSQYQACQMRFEHNTGATRAALLEWLRSFSSPAEFQAAMPPGVQGAYPAYVPKDVWFAKPSHKHLAVQGADKFTKGACKTVSSGSVGEPQTDNPFEYVVTELEKYGAVDLSASCVQSAFSACKNHGVDSSMCQDEIRKCGEAIVAAEQWKNRNQSEDEDEHRDKSEGEEESTSPWLILGVATLAIGGTWWMMTRK